MAKIYKIPVNFNQSGYVFNGLIETRRALEAAGGAVIGFLFCSLFPVSGAAAISMYLFFMIVLGLVGYLGIRGEPVTSYLYHLWKWLKIRKKPYLYNPNGEAYTVSAAQVHMDETSMQDMLAEALDGIRSKFETKAPEYIEGQTFVFASDPLAERMKYAQEQYEYEDDEEPSDDTADADNKPTAIDTDELFGDIFNTAQGGNDHG